jgi:hypothetical protein
MIGVGVNRRSLLFAAILAAAVVSLGATGCRARAPQGKLDELFIGEHRFNIDEDRGLVRIYGRLDNAGAGRFREVEVHALLRSTSGDKRGENTIALADIKPHEQRNFALTVTSHARVSDVELEIKSPETP